MSLSPIIGKILWQDLTVADATVLRDFYAAVVGWQYSPQSMGNYDDYNMNLPESGETVAGICHAQGANAELPPQWLLYIGVADLDHSIAQCQALGGKIIVAARPMGDQRFCVVQDPAGAVVALIG